MNPRNNPYWVWGWLDRYGPKNADDIARLLNDAKALDALAELGASSPRDTTQVQGEAVVASWGLGGGFWRSHGVDEVTGRVDDLLSRTWHYYDGVIVEDSIRHQIDFHWSEPLPTRQRRLTGFLAALLHLRSIGAESLIHFRDKPKICGSEWRVHAKEEGLDDLVAGADELIARVTRDARVVLKSTGGFRDIVVAHPLIPGGRVRARYDKKRSERAQARAIISDALSVPIGYIGRTY